MRKVATMTSENSRTSRSLALARRILAVGLLAGVLALLATPGGASAAGTTERVSVDSAGIEQVGGSGELDPGSVSADGRFVAFASAAINLGPPDTNGVADVFVHDRQTRTTQRVSVDSAGNQGTGSSGAPAISADGRFVAFYSEATNLVPGDTNGVADVFVHDRLTGTTERVSVDSAGTQGNSSSGSPAISADGRFVAFASLATNLVPGDTNGAWDVFVRDRQTGTTERVSVSSAGNQGDKWSIRPSVSADGRFVAFASFATNLLPSPVFGEGVYVRDRQTGTTEFVGGFGRNIGAISLSADGRFMAWGSHTSVIVHDRATGTTQGVRGCRPAISADGRYVVYAGNLVPGNTNGRWDVFVLHRQAGFTERVSVDTAGTPGNDHSGGYPIIDGCGSAYIGPSSISADGRVVAFWSSATNLVERDFNGLWDVFVHEGLADPPPLRSNGQPSPGGTFPAGTTEMTLSLTTHEDATCRYSTTPGVAYQAMTATFTTTGGTEHATTVGGLRDGESYTFYVRCQDTAGNANPDDYPIDFAVASPGASPGPTERVSVDSAGNQGNSSSGSPALSADGRFVAFASYATNLVPGDTNGIDDVFVYDRQTGITERISVDSAGNEGNGSSRIPSISADGRFVAFFSYATNLVAGDTNGAPDVFVHDRLTGTTERVSVDSAGIQGDSSSWSPSLSADGRFVAFESYATHLVPGDTNLCSDGRTTFPCNDVFVHDRETGITERVSVDSAGTQGDGGSSNPAISADGRFVAFASGATNLVPEDTNGWGDVFVHDRETGTTQRVSVDSAGIQGNGSSTSPSISADGRFVAFGSGATNLVPGDTNGRGDVFVRDRGTGTTERVSVDSAGNQGNGSSGSGGPAISADGRFVAFGSGATNLVPGDTNLRDDVFVRDRGTGTTERVSVDSFARQGNGWSFDPAISADGRFVAFFSYATNLVPGDTNGVEDVFVHGRSPDAP
jgi:Tol biopolymer transport system component